MGLVKCLTCGNDIAYEAQFCPRCGAIGVKAARIQEAGYCVQIAEQNLRRRKKSAGNTVGIIFGGILFGYAILFAISGFLGVGGFSRNAVFIIIISILILGSLAMMVVNSIFKVRKINEKNRLVKEYQEALANFESVRNG